MDCHGRDFMRYPVTSLSVRKGFDIGLNRVYNRVSRKVLLHTFSRWYIYRNISCSAEYPIFISLRRHFHLKMSVTQLSVTRLYPRSLHSITFSFKNYLTRSISDFEKQSPMRESIYVYIISRYV